MPEYAIAIILFYVLGILTFSFLLFYYEIFTPQDLYDITKMNMLSCIITYIVIHILFLPTYIVVDIVILTHLGRK